MNETPFFKTRMGQRFFEHTVPDLVQQIERLNELLERLVERQVHEEDDDAVSLPTDSDRR